MQITIRQFVKNFRQLIDQQIGSNSLQLGKGQCKNFEEYKRKVGFNDGLAAAADLADKMLQKLDEADRDNDLPTMPKEGASR